MTAAGVRARSRGFTLLETLVVTAVAGVLLAIGFLDWRQVDQDARNGALTSAALLRNARALAMATTGAVRVVLRPDGRGLQGARAAACDAADAAWTPVPDLTNLLPDGVTYADVPATWRVCFGPRGAADAGPILTAADARRRVTLRVYEAGAVEVP